MLLDSTFDSVGDPMSTLSDHCFVDGPLHLVHTPLDVRKLIQKSTPHTVSKDRLWIDSRLGLSDSELRTLATNASRRATCLRAQYGGHLTWRARRFVDHWVVWDGQVRVLSRADGVRDVPSTQFAATPSGLSISIECYRTSHYPLRRVRRDP